MMSVTFIRGARPALLPGPLRRGQNRRAGTPGLQQVSPLRRLPIEADFVSAHERAVGVGAFNATAQLATPGAAAVTGTHKGTRLADRRHGSGSLELCRCEHAFSPAGGEILEPEVGLVPIHAGDDAALWRHANRAPAAPGTRPERLPQHRVENGLCRAHQAGHAEQALESFPELLIAER